MKKINAFTLLELIVVMIISGIVIVIVLEIYVLFQKQFKQFNEQKRAEIELLQYIDTFQSDFTDATEVHNNNNVFILDYQYSKSKIKYTFFENMIIRESIKSDTFNIKVKDFEIKTEKNTKFVNYLTMLFEDINLNQNVIFYKKYNNDILVNFKIKQKK